MVLLFLLFHKESVEKAPEGSPLLPIGIKLMYPQTTKFLSHLPEPLAKLLWLPPRSKSLGGGITFSHGRTQLQML